MNTTASRWPAGSCDCHFHVFDAARYPYAEGRHYTPPDAPLSAYLAMCESIGIERGVLVHPTVFGADHRSFEDILAAHPQRLRGVAVVSPDTPEADIARWHALGARGTRVTTIFQGPDLARIREIAARVKPFGWHVQILVDVVRHPDLVAQVRAMGVPVVVDHMGHHSAATLLASSGFANLCSQLLAGEVWAKLSAPYRISADSGRDPLVSEVAQALLRAHTGRLVWGSDWPHPTSPHPVPSDERLAALALEWLPDEATRQAVLVRNPQRLYWGGGAD